MKSKDNIPGLGESRIRRLPEFDAVQFTLGRMADFICEGHTDPLVIDTAHLIATFSAEAASKNGVVLSEDNRDLVQLQGLYAWCHDRFVYVQDPIGSECIRTAANNLRRLRTPKEVLDIFWNPIQAAFAQSKLNDLGPLQCPSPKMSGDSDDATILVLTLAAAIGLSPLKMRLGGTGGSLHYVWASIGCQRRFVDCDILHPKFGEHHPFENYDEYELPLMA